MSSTDTLSDLLGVSKSRFREFLEQDWGIEPAILLCDPERASQLLTWDALGRVLQYGGLRYPRVRLVSEGRALSESAYSRIRPGYSGETFSRLMPGPIFDALAQGATLVVDAIDELDHSIGHLAYGLEQSLHERVEVNAYATWGETPGSPLHWDDHEVLVVQLSGTKHWEIYKPTRAYPLADDVEQPEIPTGSPHMRLDLEPGEMLHVPRGWWHLVVGSGGPCLHLTVGVRQATGIDLLMWVVDAMRSTELVRRSVPSVSASDSYVDNFVSEIGESLGRMLAEPNLVSNFKDYRDSQDPGRSHFSLSRLEAAGSIRIAMNDLIVPQSARITMHKREHAIDLAIGGQVWSFPLNLGDLLSKVCEGAPFTVAEALRGCGPVAEHLVQDAIRDLVRAGFVALAPS